MKSIPYIIEFLSELFARTIAANPSLFYQITMTFNPISSTHWIKARYFDRKDPEILAHHSTYLGNRFIDEGYRRRMERRKVEDPEGYCIYGEGEWGEVGGLILTNIDIGDFSEDSISASCRPIIISSLLLCYK